MVEVKVVRRDGKTMLVEWQEDGLLKRASVSPDMVVEDNGATAQVENPAAGIPYGADWWRIVELEPVTPEVLDRELKRRGIWTVADLRANPNIAQSALIAVYGVNLTRLLQAAEKDARALKEA